MSSRWRGLGNGAPKARFQRLTKTVRLLQAALAIGILAGCCDEKGLPRAIDSLQSESASERNKALHVVGRCGARSERAVPIIASLMYDKNVGVASSAAYALRRIDTPSARAALKTAEQARAQKVR
jgi:HEAT repeat protein